jgi:hypothetical protein
MINVAADQRTQLFSIAERGERAINAADDFT